MGGKEVLEEEANDENKDWGVNCLFSNLYSYDI